MRFLAQFFIVLALATICVHSCQTVGQRFQFGTSNVYLRLTRDSTTSKLQYEIMKGSDVLQTVTFDNLETQRQLTMVNDKTYQLVVDGVIIKFNLVSSTSDGIHINVYRENLPQSTEQRDCLSLDMPNTHWYGGPQQKKQYWPVEKTSYSNYALIPKELDNAGIAERYWVNSKGMFIYVEETTPLFIEQNSAGFENKLCLQVKNALPYNKRVTSPSFSYHLFFAKNAKVAHMQAVMKFLGQPTGYPDERMITYPIWSTWALYQRDINESIVREFANDIRKYNFKDSQLEIDDFWETCYGSLTINEDRFPDMKKLTDDLKKQGFRVTLWIHPFINKDCTESYQEALSKGYFVKDYNGNPDTKWWNSGENEAAYLDFTKAEVREWFVSRLKKLQEIGGFDSYKFDAGETSWVPDDPVLQGDQNTSPTSVTVDYVKTIVEFGSMMELRTGWGTQDLPVFVRMIDKDSEWDWSNGLRTLVTTLLQMNIQGYPLVLPDMIGGNGYNNKPPTQELFLRWLQANVFMPALQYSFVPWTFEDTLEETVRISQKFTDLHAEYAPQIIERLKLAVETGEPVNPPLWWIAPNDPVAQSIYDEYLLGEDIIVAPVMEDQARKRDIYLPSGKWKDGNSDTVYTGPLWVMDYSAPLDVLPYFIKASTS